MERAKPYDSPYEQQKPIPARTKLTIEAGTNKPKRVKQKDALIYREGLGQIQQSPDGNALTTKAKLQKGK